MRKCYVCNKILIDGAPVDTEHEAKSHGEHIIHNAIGGHLISHNILC